MEMNGSRLDFSSRKELAQLQLSRLQKIVARAYEKVSLTRERMQALKIKPEDIKSLKDIEKLPFMVKTDLRDTYPYGLFASPMEDIVRMHVSSGTTGKPIVVAYTQEDLEVWACVMKRTLIACGLSQHDIVQNSFGYGLFTGGLGAHYGAEKLGATVVPISGGNTERQIMLMKDFMVTTIFSTPSYFLHLIDTANDMGVDIKNLPLKIGIFGAEPWTETMRHRVEDVSGIKAYDIYGLSEIIGPGVASECSAQNGLHIFEDCFYPEIIDPDTGVTLPEGQEGELVLTTLCKSAMPMIRYRTRDITCLIPGKCSCGRTIRRIKRIERRSDDMLIIRGVNVFPSQIESALLKVEGTLPHYQIIITNQDGLDQIEVQVEITPEFFKDTVESLEKLTAALTHSIMTTIGIRVKLSLVEPKSLQRSEGKAKRVIDNR